MQQHIKITKEGLAALQKEYEQLKIQRVDAVGHLKKSREMGDLSENGYYKASRLKLSFIDRQIREVSSLLKASVVTQPITAHSVSFGSTVSIREGKNSVTYQIVSSREADPAKNLISEHSPIGRALLGKKVGESVTITIPQGIILYTVEKIA
ncbi:MAG: transcription elongation factor GreA [Candidatus Levybacteria bacterium]|nr:transcription elongation factor GreA [Candidatus Levybacteria bacterium]